MRFDSSTFCLTAPNRNLVYPNVENEDELVAATSVNKEKVKGILGVQTSQEQHEVERLLSRSGREESNVGSVDEHGFGEERPELADGGNVYVCKSLDQDQRNSLVPKSSSDSHNRNRRPSSFKAFTRSRVEKAQLIQGLVDGSCKFLLQKNWQNSPKDMPEEFNNGELCHGTVPLRIVAETGKDDICAKTFLPVTVFPLPPPEILQRKDISPAAHPLPQPPVSSSSAYQASRSQPNEEKVNTQWISQSVKAVSMREKLPLPPMVEHGRPTILEAQSQRYSETAAVTHKSYPSSRSARDLSRPFHLLPSPPSGGNNSSSPSSSSPSSSSPSSPRVTKLRCPRKWRKGNLLGQGTFGVVHEGLNLEDGSFFAVKISNGQDAFREIQQEVDLLSKLEHPNIVRYLGSSVENGQLCIFLELVRMGSLETNLRKFTCFEEKTVRIYTRQILQGLEYLHSQKTIHRDIKCANILVDVTGQVKLADFGIAKEVSEILAKSSKGTALYMAPEVLTPRQRCYTFSADIWSLGTYGKNLSRAGFGSCVAKGGVHFLLLATALVTYVLFLCAYGHQYLYASIFILICAASYASFYRIQIRRKFNIKGKDIDGFVSAFDDSLNHFICGCCALCQEARTLEINNVQDGNWRGRGDTIWVGSYAMPANQQGTESLELKPPVIITISSSDRSDNHSHGQTAGSSGICPHSQTG